jgi:hypothetical protein
MRSSLLALLLLAGCPPENDTGDTGDLPPSDQDQDGYTSDVDCDDQRATVYPGAEELCDGFDNDCDEDLAPGEDDLDQDGEPDCTRCDLAGFWVDTRALNDPDALEVALSDLTDGLSCSYSSTATYMFVRLDNETGLVECVYTGRTTTVTSERPDPETDMNTEHTWPQSQGADQLPAKCDLHHLYPSDVQANQARAAYPFGVVVSGVTWEEGGSRLGRDAGGALVFEPRTVHRGNVARSMLYFSMRYDMPLPANQVDLFLQWHEDDPVDLDEWDRTMEIAEYQAAANPFVACPDMADRVY